MVPIETAIEELNRGDVDLVSSTGNEPVTTAGELVILLERLRDLDSLTHVIPLAIVVKRTGRVDLTTHLSVTVPIDVDAAEVQNVLMAARSLVDEPLPGKILAAVRQACDFNGWTLGGEYIPERAVVDMTFESEDT